MNLNQAIKLLKIVLSDHIQNWLDHEINNPDFFILKIVETVTIK